MKRNRYTYNDVYNIFKKENWTLLSSNYKDNKQSLEVLCSNKHKLTINLNNFLTGWRCLECSGRRRLNIDVIKQEFEKENYNLLSTKYINTQSKLDVICPKGHHVSFAYSHFYSGERCGECFGKKTLSLNKVKELFNTKNYLVLSTKYKNNKTPLKIKCDKGHITNTLTVNNFQSGAICYKCYLISNSGENNRNYNPFLTNEDRRKNKFNKKYQSWIFKIFKRDNFTCKCCGDKTGGNLNAHHLEGYHWCKELRFEISNGITLCKDCHNKFHKKFGLGWNTTEQFVKFLRSFK